MNIRVIFKKFKQDLCSKEKFYSSLIGKNISDNEQEHAFNIENKFEMKMMKGYHHFQKFRNNNLKNYGFFQSHFLRVPGLSRDEMLKMKKVELELITDPDMFKFFEKDTRDRISYISNRYSTATNMHLKSLSKLSKTRITT